jgi:NADPH:quinone reductase-like Zn-dependent oxidoreductase
MKAAVYHRYGPPEVIEIKDVEKPVPKDSQVLNMCDEGGFTPKV